jgi:hypothetical protein
MTAAMALLLSVIVSVIAVLHASWGLGGHWPAANAERLAKSAVGTPNIKAMPSATACFVVAALLAGVASWPLFATGLLEEAWPRWLTLLAGAGIAAVFIGRGIAGYTQAWRRRFSEQPFASLDRVIYSPLCLVLGAGYLTILFLGRTS